MTSYTANDLASVLDKLPASDHDFAASLISQAERRGLTERQLFYVNKLVTKARAEKVQVGSLAATIELFDRAAKHLKHPKVVITVDGQPVRLSVAGPRSRQPGTLNVAEPGPFGDVKWYGRVTRDGVFHPTADTASLPGLPAALQRFASDPATVAAEHGKLTGNCSFCNRPLKDERSTAVGYGPVCADHFNLPWG